MGSRSTQVRMAEKKGPQWAFGVVGFLLVVSLTVIAYVSAPAVISWLKSNANGFTTVGLPDSQVQLMFTGIVFLVLLAVVGVIVFAFAPKQTNTSSMDRMVKEREEMLREKRASKKRQRTVNRTMRESVKDKMN